MKSEYAKQQEQEAKRLDKLAEKTKKEYTKAQEKEQKRLDKLAKKS